MVTDPAHRDSAHRGVAIDRVTAGHFTARNDTGGDAARALLPDAVRRSHDRLCTVSRTIELGIPVTSRVEAG